MESHLRREGGAIKKAMPQTLSKIERAAVFLLLGLMSNDMTLIACESLSAWSNTVTIQQADLYGQHAMPSAFGWSPGRGLEGGR